MAAGKINKYLALSIILLTSCVEPFDPPKRDAEIGFLVVDGYINTTNHTATVVLSRAVPLSAANFFPREMGAVVRIQEDNGKTYSLLPGQNGVYQLTDPGFEAGKKYQLQIRTAGRDEYRSESITTKVSPPINSIDWVANPEGVTVRIDTEDESKNTRYYRWEYVETWQYEAPMSSQYKLVNGFAVERPVAEQVKTCFAEKLSEEIIIGTTTNFSEDKFVDHEIAFIPFLSPKTRIHYSVLVRQFALTKEAYDYWQQLSINTESLGGLFDPQPSQMRGNIQNVDDAGEQVIGYFDGGAVAEKRLFIRYGELPEYLQSVPVSSCIEETIPPHRVGELANFYIITHAIYDGPALVAYAYAIPECADCRLQGGTTMKPSFWPN